MKVLVTGAGGYIGRVLVKTLLEVGAVKDSPLQIMAVDNGANSDMSQGSWLYRAQQKQLSLTGSSLSAIALRILHKDFADIEAQLKAFAPEVVVHLAAQKSVLKGEENPEFYWQENVLKTAAFAQVCADANVKTFVFASTAAVYGKDSDPAVENQDLAPLSVYGTTKEAGELLLARIAEKTSMKVRAARFFNVVGASECVVEEGEGEMLGDDGEEYASTLFGALLKSADPSEAPAILRTKLDHTMALTPTRDFVHVEDLCSALRSIMFVEKDPKFMPVNIGMGHPKSIESVALMMQQKWPAVKFVYGMANPAEIVNSYCSIQRLRHAFGWYPHRNLYDCVESAIAHAKSLQKVKKPV